MIGRHILYQWMITYLRIATPDTHRQSFDEIGVKIYPTYQINVADEAVQSAVKSPQANKICP